MKEAIRDGVTERNKGQFSGIEKPTTTLAKQVAQETSARKAVENRESGRELELRLRSEASTAAPQDTKVEWAAVGNVGGVGL